MEDKKNKKNKETNNKVKETKNKKEKNIKKEEVKVAPKKKVNKDTDKVFKFYEFFDKYHLAIYGALGGILVTVLVVVLIWPDRIATLKDGTQPVATIDGMTLTADELYEDMKDIYSVSSLLDKLDTKILTDKYPDTDEMDDEVTSQAENYYKAYEQYYKMSKEDFLKQNGFNTEKKFLEYLKLNNRRTKYVKEYTENEVTDKEIDKYYEDKVYGDINTKHMLVKVDSSASDDDKKEAENLAKEIISKLDEGKTFDEVKEEYKDKITYEELGYKSYNAALEEAYKNEMKNLKDGEYSKEPVKTSYGYHIVYRIDQKEKPALEDIKDQIKEEIADEKISNDKNLYYVVLDKMRENANLKFEDTVLKDKYDNYMSQYK
ncbi:MAG: peptidylprolyl isomerase [Bacilli bacterium]|nr:peptidylprolyl isomerase [Bacilli bacterium]MDY5996709.1 peptidylprolyl isomerase [Bacilli bacterium]